LFGHDLAAKLINDDGHLLLFIDHLSAGNLDFASGNTRCVRSQNFGKPALW